MVVADLRDTDWSAKDLNEHLLRHNVVASASSLPRRSSSAKRLGLRLGSVAMTICGADRDAFVCIGAAVAKIIKTRSALVDPDLARNLREIADAYPPPVD
jgi:glycine/serine hydroxymethyltransferase